MGKKKRTSTSKSLYANSKPREVKPPQEMTQMFYSKDFSAVYSRNGLRPVSITLVGDSRSDFIVIRDAYLGAVHELLESHLQSARKDGPALIWGHQTGDRTNNGTVSVSALVYDRDGPSFDLTCEVVEKAGYEARVHTTFGHKNTTGVVKVAQFQAWSGKSGIAFAFNNLNLVRYLIENGKGHLTECAVQNDGAFRWVDQRGKKVAVFDFCHSPEDKSRIIIPLEEPIPIQGPSGVGNDGYRDIYNASGEWLFGSDGFDRSCANPSRLQYLPSHPEERAAHARNLFYEGPLLNWKPIWEARSSDVIKRRLEAAESSRARLSSPPDLSEIAHTLKSIPPSINRKEWFSVIVAIHTETAGSNEGWQLAHEWSAGAPHLYDSSALDDIWEWVDPKHKVGFTMGTLIWLARKYDDHFRPLKRQANFALGLELTKNFLKEQSRG